MAAATWLFPATDSVQPSRDLGVILRAYRRASALTQQQLAEMLGYDRTDISMIECGRRSITDRGTLAHIARALAIPPHVLGITGPDDADFASMIQFGASIIRLAGVARHSGRAAEAVSELWPLITGLESRLAAGHAEPRAMRLLAQARVSFGVALGHLLPEQRLASAAPQWRVIERITTAEVLTKAGDKQTAERILSAAIGDAETLRLPHQVQRIIRLADGPGALTRHTVHGQAEAALTRLERQLAGTAATSGTLAATLTTQKPPSSPPSSH